MSGSGVLAKRRDSELSNAEHLTRSGLVRSRDRSAWRGASLSSTCVGPHALRIAFADGSEQTIDFAPVLLGELFGPLRDPEVFGRVRLDTEVNSWSGQTAPTSTRRRSTTGRLWLTSWRPARDLGRRQAIVPSSRLSLAKRVSTCAGIRAQFLPGHRVTGWINVELNHEEPTR